MQNRIREMRLARKWSLQNLADAVGTSAPQIQRLETSQRQLTLNWMKRISKVFNCLPGDLIVDEKPTFSKRNPGQLVNIVANVQSGKFYSVNSDLYDWTADAGIEAVIPPAYAKFPVFAVLVADDSMNVLYPRGNYLLAVRLADLGKYQLQDDDVVIVERRNAAGVELTARQVESNYTNGSVGLWPRSNNERFSQPFLLKPAAMYVTLQETAVSAAQSVSKARLAKLRTANPTRDDVITVSALVIGNTRGS